MSHNLSRKFRQSWPAPVSRGVRWCFGRSQRPAVLLLSLALCALAGGRAAAQEATTITAVEEDWFIQVGTPSPEETAPQITIVTTPTGHLQGHYAVFEMNHIPVPEFFSGGLQLQSWSGEQNLGARHFANTSGLAIPGEQITFTVRMSVQDGRLRFKVVNGQSQTWGNFGDEGSLRQRVFTSMTNLNGYDPDKSAEFSRVSFAGNRVSKLALKRVRYYSGSTLLDTDETERTIHAYTGGE